MKRTMKWIRVYGVAMRKKPWKRTRRMFQSRSRSPSLRQSLRLKRITRAKVRTRTKMMSQCLPGGRGNGKHGVSFRTRNQTLTRMPTTQLQTSQTQCLRCHRHLHPCDRHSAKDVVQSRIGLKMSLILRDHLNLPRLQLRVRFVLGLALLLLPTGPPALLQTMSELFFACKFWSVHGRNKADEHSSPTPKKQRSPCKEPPRPSTPPAMESPSKLVSPSKKKMRIPQVPDLRPSLDAFWNPEVVNDWNDKHSPVKPLVSPRKQKPLKDLDRQTKAITIFDDGESDASFTSPAASPRKKSASPAKRSVSPSVAQIRAQKKDFASRKHALAEEFLAELDNTIAEGRIASLSQSTGGIKLVWSKTLKTTAGRANWRRETLRLRNGPEPTDVRTEIRHHCSIELADKVIDDEERLANVLAHEFCHLTTFMISGVRNNPHGAEFKAWGRKATEAFQQSRNVVVTTKHSYQIDYKFVWECTECGYEFKRHSRSVDPARHSCGRCKGKLVQTKPVPRGQGKTADGKGEKKSEYQSFVKENFARVKKGMEAKGLDVQMGKVMEEVAREYRERKAEKAKLDVAEVELALEGLNLG